MLSSNLIRVRVQKKELRPHFVRTGDAKYQERAEELIAIFREGIERQSTREQLAQAVDDLIGDGIEHKRIRGLAKVAADHSEFGAEQSIAPSELREQLFERVGMNPSRAQAVRSYRELGEELSIAPEDIKRLLYADRKKEQVVVSCDVPSGDWLLNRYNLALVQALLLRCSEMTVTLKAPSPERSRQLFRTLKFHGLMHQLEPTPEGFQLQINGPASLLRLNTRYGMALANWFPNLVLQECDWKVEACVHWTRRNLRKQMEINSEDGLRSHYRDQGAYVTQTESWFQERFEALDCGWSIRREGTPLDLGGESVVIPDFCFEKEGRRAYLEILGFWRKGWLKKRMKLLEAQGPGNLVVAVSTKLAGSKEAVSKFPGRVVYFKEVVPAKDVLACIEDCAQAP